MTPNIYYTTIYLALKCDILNLSCFYTKTVTI